MGDFVVVMHDIVNSRSQYDGKMKMNVGQVLELLDSWTSANGAFGFVH